MFILCRFSVVVFQLMLVSHIAHSFVLLTANVDDVKKIARKFVSDELAEKIADFIARATETFAQQSRKTSEENIKDNSEVSEENKMYNIKRHGFDRLNIDEEKSKRQNVGKEKITTTTEKKKTTEITNTDTTRKPKKETRGKSRYIVDSDQKDTTATGKPPKPDEDNGLDIMKDSMKFIEDNILSATDKTKTKKPKQKKKTKVKPYKLLSTLYSDETNVKDDTLDSQENDEKKEEIKRSQRAFDDEIVRNTALENKDKKSYVKLPLPVKDEPKQDDNEVKTKTEKTTKSASIVIENNDKDGNWWEKDLPKHNQDDANLKRKSWF